MKELLPVGCVIMASGLSQRFGSNKLLAPFCGEPMLCRAFAATDTPKLSARIVVTRSDEVAQLCRSRNVPVLLHDLPGRNDTVRLGLSALLEQVPELFGCMFLPGDQPLLCRETVRLLAYSLDAEYGRGSFSLYRIDGDGEGCHIRIGTKECRFMSEGCPHTLHVMGWGRYMRN